MHSAISLNAMPAPSSKAGGGEVVSVIRHPLNTSDFSSHSLRAQSSGANVIALANAGADTANTVKQARNSASVKANRTGGFGGIHQRRPRPRASVAQGLVLTSAFYWDMNDQTRAWAKRFVARKWRQISNYGPCRRVCRCAALSQVHRERKNRCRA